MCTFQYKKIPFLERFSLFFLEIPAISVNYTSGTCCWEHQSFNKSFFFLKIIKVYLYSTTIMYVFLRKKKDNGMLIRMLVQTAYQTRCCILHLNMVFVWGPKGPKPMCHSTFAGEIWSHRHQPYQCKCFQRAFSLGLLGLVSLLVPYLLLIHFATLLCIYHPCDDRNVVSQATPPAPPRSQTLGLCFCSSESRSPPSMPSFCISNQYTLFRSV